MYYLIYKIINKINGKYYIGAHQTSVINDGYMGSGILLEKALKKYGKRNFKRVILKKCKNKKEMFQLEKKLVNAAFVKSTLTYNLREGGIGGFSKKVVKARIKRFKEDLEFSNPIRSKIANTVKDLWKNPEYRSHMVEVHLKKNLSKTTIKKMSDSHKGCKFKASTLRKRSRAIKEVWANKEYKEKLSKKFKGRIVSSATKRKMSIAAKQAWKLRKAKGK